MKNKQVAIKKNYFSPEVWEQMTKMAQVFIQSGAMPKNIANAQQAIVIMQTGFEMGMKPMEAIRSLYIVNGQVNVWGAATIRRLKEHGWDIKYEMEADKGGSCKATVTKDRKNYSETYSFQSAEKSGYTTDSYGKLKVGWREGVNRNMKLRYGAISMIIKSYLPEVLGSATDITEMAEDYKIPVNEEVKKIDLKLPEKIITVVDLKSKENNLKDFIEQNKKKTVIVEAEVIKDKKEIKSGK